MSQLSNTFDVIIVGAGASGLWLANDLKNAGYSIALLCDGKIGNGQTICSQGIIHTGIKYVFSDILDDFFYSLHPVCQRWDEHFKNKLRPYLSSTNIESHKTTIWSDIEIEDTLSSVFGIQNIINKIKYQKKENGFHQYQIEEKTIDINTLIYALSKDIFENIIFYDSKSILFKSDSTGDVSDLSIKTTDGRHLERFLLNFCFQFLMQKL